jgi:hypothetical protein
MILVKGIARCEGCAKELALGIIPNYSEITSSGAPHKPAGVSIRFVLRTPGTGDGNDYFGNHT